MEKASAKLRLKATLEASRIFRLGESNMYDQLKSFEAELKGKKINGIRREYLETLVGVINEKIDKSIDSANISFDPID